MINLKKKGFLFVLGIMFFIPTFTQAVWSNSENFFIESEYDLYERKEMEAQLLKTTNQFYIYVDKQWYENFNQKQGFNDKIYNLVTYFEYKTYPILTELLGAEDNPGIDNDSRLVLILGPFKNTIGGYVRVADKDSQEVQEYSNQGQIIYLNSDLILKIPSGVLNYQLAHEFTHLITLFQKPGAETWFYELMSEFAGQIIGADISPITKQRAQSLVYSSEINLIDWVNSDEGYGKVYLFALYLREQFGKQLFQEVLQYPFSNAVIAFNEVFKKYHTNFDEVVLNWLISSIVNDCSLGDKYCYQDLNLNQFQIISNNAYFLPTKYESGISATSSITPFTGKLQKINGGFGTVKLIFTIPEQTPFKIVPYIIESIDNKKTLGFFDFSNSNIQEVVIKSMGNENRAIYFIPFIGLLGEQDTIYYYSWEINTIESIKEQEQVIIQGLLKRIEELKKEIAVLETQLARQGFYEENLYCSVFSQDLYYGMRAEQVKCLQQFLARLDNDVYPEKLITGYYGPLTLAAVKRYQSYNGINTTGYFGPITRNMVNKSL